MTSLTIDKFNDFTLVKLPIEQLIFGKFHRFDLKINSIENMASTIKSCGLLQPPIVKKIDNQQYLIICGHRRIAAAMSLGWPDIQAILYTGEDEQILSILENLQRENLSPRELGLAMLSLADSGKWTQDQLAAMLGQNKSTISRTISLGCLVKEYGNAVSFTKLPTSTYFELLDTPELLVLAEDRNWSQKKARKEATKRKKGSLADRELRKSTGRSATRTHRSSEEAGEPILISNDGFEINYFCFSSRSKSDIEAAIEWLNALEQKVPILVKMLRELQNSSSLSETTDLNIEKQFKIFEDFADA